MLILAISGKFELTSEVKMEVVVTKKALSSFIIVENITIIERFLTIKRIQHTVYIWICILKSQMKLAL